MASEFNFNEFNAYIQRVRDMQFQFEGWIRGFLLNEGLRFLAYVKPRTPVDTGDLREHWQLERFTREGDDLRIWFVNPMYYATFVEYGHAKPYNSGATPGSEDWVDGYFMMTVSLAYIERNLPRRFDKAFLDWCHGLGVI